MTKSQRISMYMDLHGVSTRVAHDAIMSGKDITQPPTVGFATRIREYREKHHCSLKEAAEAVRGDNVIDTSAAYADSRCYRHKERFADNTLFVERCADDVIILHTRLGASSECSRTRVELLERLVKQGVWIEI